MTSEQLFFAAIVGLQFFFPGHNMCRAIFFYSNFFWKGREGVKIGSELCFAIIILLI